MPDDILRLIEVAIEPERPNDAERLSATLRQIAAADSRLAAAIDAESGQTILQGVSEAFLKEVLAGLADIPVRCGAPQVAYRESLREAATIEHVHKWQQAGTGEFAWVRIAFEPLPESGDVIFQNVADGPEEFVRAVEKGIRRAAQDGVLAGFPVTGFKATLLELRYHNFDSSARVFDIAARASFRELAQKRSVQLVEPIMLVEVAIPEKYLGGVMGDLDSRRGQTSQTAEGEIFALVKAEVPLANMFGYGRSLNSMTAGRGTFEMRFERFAPVPQQPSDDDPNFPGAMAMRVA
jgi:elongation factor G